MSRLPLHAAIAAALFATLALAGCKKPEEAATTPSPATAPMPGPATTPPAPAPFSVVSVDLGNAVGVDNRVSAPLTSFAKADTIHASVATAGGTAGNLGAKWTYQDDQVVDNQEKSVPAGPQVTAFSISKPSGWPAGHYKLEISTNGQVVQMREFDVK